MKTVFASFAGWFQALSSTKQTLLAILGLCTGLLLLSWGLQTLHHLSKSPGSPNSAYLLSQEQLEADRKAQWERIRQNSTTIAPMAAAVGQKTTDSLEDPSGYATPMIAHAEDLGLTTKEFVRSRRSMEEILDRHHGYAAKLRMVGQPASSLLTATLRVPSSEFEATASDLKTLGNVEREEQTADEIAQQRADLEARLTNAQNSLARLQAILAKGGKVTDLAKVERELANVSAEIARLESERITAGRRVTFAQVLFSLREEVTPPVESLAAQFQSAVRCGISDLVSSVSGIVLFVMSRGPALLLWVVLLFFPSRWIWRKWRAETATSQAVAHGG